MANINSPSGLKPVKYLNGSPWNGKANVYYASAANDEDICRGDIVKVVGGADATGKYAEVGLIKPGDKAVGVVIGFGEQPEIMVNAGNPDRKYREGFKEMYLLVVDDPAVIFEVQENSSPAPLLAADVNKYCDIDPGTFNATTGKSGMMLDSSTANVATSICKLLGVVNREDNELGQYCKWNVLLAMHEY